MLLDPRNLSRPYPDERSAQIMRSTVDFFESKGKAALKRDDHQRVWYQDFIDFQGRERIFSTLLTPAAYGKDPDTRWDTWRLCEFAEILGFYGLQYWYTWQVTILGLGPIWMSENEEAKRRAAKFLEDGEVFAFGLSERTHGADVYSTDMILSQNGSGLRANGEKYYIGNGNAARMVSTFGRLEGEGDYVFFAADSQHPNYELLGNVVASQNYVSNYRLNDYPVSDVDILHRGGDAFSAALNTVNVGKYNLGWASIGICTHALYEAITHAANRRLYGVAVTDFPHAKRLFTDAYARTVAMKLVALRAADYMRSASREDRRYLLYNPVVKMKVTTEGEKAIVDMWDVIAAKGFEKDTYFEMASRDIQALPRLEGTVHVNIALILKFMPAYLLDPAEGLPEIDQRDDAADDSFLFDQGSTGGLSAVRFHDFQRAFEPKLHLPNIAVFRGQVDVLRDLLVNAPPADEQRLDIDFLQAFGQLFTLVVYAGLVLENAPVYDISDDLLDEVFDVFVRDFSAYAVALHGKAATTPEQAQRCLKMVNKPVADAARYDRVWEEHVLSLSGRYEMNP